MMGGTLPALARYAADERSSVVGSVGGLYGLNTLGAFLGTLAAGFLLLPAFGLSATLRLTAAVNLVIGAAALGLAKRAAASAEEGEEAAEPAGDVVSGRRHIVFAFALTGLAALALEVAWTRVLTLVIGPSVYAFSLMLAAFLAGLGLGALIFSWAIARFRWRGTAPFIALSAAAGILAFLTTLAFGRLPLLYASFFLSWGALADPRALFAIGLAISGLVMLPATLAMGGLFPAALQAAQLSRRAAGRATGALYAANSAGAIAGAFAAGFVLVPLVGLQGTVLTAAWLYLLVAGGLALITYRGSRAAWLLAAAAGGYEAVPSPDDLDWSGRGYEELFYEEGLVSTVLVAREGTLYGRLGEDSLPSVFLVVSGKVDASSVSDMPTQIMSAHIPLALHRRPRRVAVIGLASGTTAGSALRHEIESLDVVEIEPAIVEASHEFDFVNGRPLEDPRTRVTVADGRTFLSLGDNPFDVIISEPSNPWMSGVSNLFTREYFELARARLADGGIFAQWVQMYGMSPENVRVLLRTFQAVFPEAYVFNTLQFADLLLIGSVDGLRIDPEAIARRVGAASVSADLHRIGVEDAAGLLAYGRLGPAELSDLIGPAGPLNTDDNAYIEFRAPLDLYRQTRGDNERQIGMFAAGLAPYLSSADAGALAAFLERLAAEYRARSYLGEADAALRVADSLQTPD
jgi:spermidine synthase